MVFEQMLTILLGTGVGVAAVLYAVKPRPVGASQSFVSGASSIETLSTSHSVIDSENSTAPMPEVTATQPSIVEAPAEEAHVMASSVVSTMTAEVAAAGSSPATSIASIDASAVSFPAVSAVMVGSPSALAEKSPKVRARRKSATSSRRRAKSSTSSSPTTAPEGSPTTAPHALE
jgi:hypothetical protein